MSEKSAQLRREEVRHAVLAHLFDRSSVAQSAATIHRSLRRQYDHGVEEVEEAANYLTGDGHLEAVRDPHGATKHYRITTAGIRVYEQSLV